MGAGGGGLGGIRGMGGGMGMGGGFGARRGGVSFFLWLFFFHAFLVSFLCNWRPVLAGFHFSFFSGTEQYTVFPLTLALRPARLVHSLLYAVSCFFFFNYTIWSLLLLLIIAYFQCIFISLRGNRSI